MTVATVQGRGHDCYVLCASVIDLPGRYTGCDACFAIDDIIQFASAVAFKIPYFVRGWEGHVIYQDEPITKDLGDVRAEDQLEKYRQPDGTISMNFLSDVANRVGGPEELFLKRRKHAGDFEYRLLWASGEPTEEIIDIKVPEALAFCRRLR